MIKVVICDGDGTLELPNPSAQIHTLLHEMKRLNITLAVASNGISPNSIRNNISKAGLEVPEIIITKADIGYPKPHPDFIHKIKEVADVEYREMVYLGDDDNTDIFCAINGHILPFSAGYSKSQTPRNYGLPVLTPKHFQDYLLTYGTQLEPYFGWTFNNECLDTGKNITVNVLFGDHEGHTEELKKILKDRDDILIGSNNNSLRKILFHYLISQTYLSGLTHDVDFWTVYPSHLEYSNNELLSDFCQTAALVFKDRFLPDILIRHSTAPELKTMNWKVRAIHNQFNTIYVKPEYSRKVNNKKILILDDFTTSGISLETARRMLIKAGAAEVICVAFGKYTNIHTQTIISKDWNPFEPITFAENDIVTNRMGGNFNQNADNYFWETILETYKQ